MCCSLSTCEGLSKSNDEHATPSTVGTANRLLLSEECRWRVHIMSGNSTSAFVKCERAKWHSSSSFFSHRLFAFVSRRTTTCASAMGKTLTGKTAAVCTAVAFILVVIAFTTPNWLETDGKLENPKFVKIGEIIWMLCNQITYRCIRDASEDWHNNCSDTWSFIIPERPMKFLWNSQLCSGIVQLRVLKWSGRVHSIWTCILRWKKRYRYRNQRSHRVWSFQVSGKCVSKASRTHIISMIPGSTVAGGCSKRNTTSYTTSFCLTSSLPRSFSSRYVWRCCWSAASWPSCIPAVPVIMRSISCYCGWTVVF